ncbi:MAG: DegV family protein [Clostridia bacterium]
MKIKLTADSTVDMSKELLKRCDVATIPLIVRLGETDYLDGETIFADDIYDYVSENKVLPKTAAVNGTRYYENFNKFLGNGYDAIIHFNISSKMSACYQNACHVSEKIKNIYVIDTYSLSTGSALLVMYAHDLISKGLSAEEIVAKVKARIPAIQASFIVDKLDYLYKGGRCSSIALLGANLLGIRPSIEVHNGQMSVARKYVGTLKHAIRKYTEDILEFFPKIDHSRAFITHSKINDEYVQVIRKALEGEGFQEIFETNAGCTITSHCGANTIGLLYMNDGDQPK